MEEMEKEKRLFLNLRGKKGFILVSHDRDILDACIDHVLVLNRKTIEVQSGNFFKLVGKQDAEGSFCDGGK